MKRKIRKEKKEEHERSKGTREGGVEEIAETGAIAIVRRGVKGKPGKATMENTVPGEV
jgi:hypothetical protein